jgi:hypothetical protein
VHRSGRGILRWSSKAKSGASNARESTCLASEPSDLSPAQLCIIFCDYVLYVQQSYWYTWQVVRSSVGYQYTQWILCTVHDDALNVHDLHTSTPPLPVIYPSSLHTICHVSSQGAAGGLSKTLVLSDPMMGPKQWASFKGSLLFDLCLFSIQNTQRTYFEWLIEQVIIPFS